MEEMQNYNLNLTQQPFEGNFRRGRGAKIIYDAHDKILGSVSKKKVFDLNGEEIALLKKEFDIIEVLSQNPGQVFDKERLYEAAWGIDGLGNNSVVAEHIRKIRAKFAAAHAK